MSKDICGAQAHSGDASTNAHTPGPSIAGEMGSSEADTTICYVRSEACSPVEVMHGAPDVCICQGWANAHLIAAAPDTTRSLAQMIEALENYGLQKLPGYVRKQVAEGCAALRKANGGQ